MINVFVKKNANDEWTVAGIISSPYNVRGLVSGIIYGDIRYVDKTTLTADGIWQQDDIYENNDEYLEFDHTETVFDEEAGIVTNTYIYKRMNLDYIKNDLIGRVASYRENLVNSGYEYNSKTFGTDTESLQWLTSLVVYSGLNTSLTNIDIRIPSGEVITLPVTEFEELFSDIIEHINGYYTEENTIVTNIKATTTYEDARAAAVWDGQPL